MKKRLFTLDMTVVINTAEQDIKVKTFIHDLMEKMTMNFFYRNAY